VHKPEGDEEVGARSEAARGAGCPLGGARRRSTPSATVAPVRPPGRLLPTWDQRTPPASRCWRTPCVLVYRRPDWPAGSGAERERGTPRAVLRAVRQSVPRFGLGSLV